MANEYTSAHERISLCDTLDRVLNKGTVVTGEIVISVADIPLIYLGLQITLTSVETAMAILRTSGPPRRSNLPTPSMASERVEYD